MTWQKPFAKGFLKNQFEPRQRQNHHSESGKRVFPLQKVFILRTFSYRRPEPDSPEFDSAIPLRD
jgi:hypothetical protein